VEPDNSVSSGLQKLRHDLQAHYGKGAFKKAAEELDEPYHELLKAISHATIDRVERLEAVVDGGDSDG